MQRTVPAVWSLVACLVLLASTTATAQPGPACVAPTGGDDTALLQAQLDRCSGGRPNCTVRLCSGVFNTGILRVRNFRGTLRGAGPTATTLRALPALPVNANSSGFFRDDPFSADADPWPYLLQFVEGRATIQDLGILIPAPSDPSRPTSGWFLLPDLGPFFELRGAVLLTGRERVDFEVRRVRVEAEADALSDLATTAFGGDCFSDSSSISTAFSIDGSRPAWMASGRSITSTSGATPSFSTCQLPSSPMKRNVAASSSPPSARPGLPLMPIRPPQVRVPISGPRLSLRK